MEAPSWIERSEAPKERSAGRVENYLMWIERFRGRIERFRGLTRNAGVLEEGFHQVIDANGRRPDDDLKKELEQPLNDRYGPGTRWKQAQLMPTVL